MVRMLYTNNETYGVDMAVYYVENGMLNMRLWSKSAVVVKIIQNLLHKGISALMV